MHTIHANVKLRYAVQPMPVGMAYNYEGSVQQLRLYYTHFPEISCKLAANFCSPCSTTKALDDSVLVCEIFLNLRSHVEYRTVSTATKITVSS